MAWFTSPASLTTQAAPAAIDSDQAPRAARALRVEPARRATPTAVRRADPAEPQPDYVAAVIAFQSGDGRALAELMTRFTPAMTSAARRYLNCRQDVEDAVQDAWVAFARCAPGIESPAAVSGWLRTTTSRAALSIAQRQSRCRPSDLTNGSRLAPVDDAGELAGLDAAQETAMVREAVGRLDHQDQEMVQMLFAAELPYTEIATRTGRAVGGIGPTRQRIIAKLRRDGAICRHRVALAAA